MNHRKSLYPVCFLLVLALPLAAQEDRGLKILPLRDLLYTSPSQVPPRSNTLLGIEDKSMRSLLAERRFRILQRDQLLGLVRVSAGAVMEEEGVSTAIIGDVLMATGHRKALAAIEKALNGIRATMARRLRLEARIYQTRGKQTFPALVKAADLAELTRGLPMLWKAHATTHSGEQVTMAQERLTSFVQDVDVEVAQDSKIGDPKVASLFEGVRLLVETHALVGGKEAVVLCQFAIGDLRGPLSQRPTGVPELAALDRPVLDSNYGTFSGRLRKGDALVVSLQSNNESGSNMALVLKVADAQKREDAAPADIAILPISALLTHSLRHLQIGFDDGGGNDGAAPVTGTRGNTEGDTAYLTGDQLVGILSGSLNLDEQEGASLDVAGGYLLLKAKPASRTQATQLLSSLQDLWLRTVEVRADTNLTRVENGGSFSKPAAEEGSVSHQSISFPALAGRAHVLAKGVETTTTRDFDVEVAQEAAMMNPSITTVFSGVIVLARPQSSNQTLGADLQLYLAHVDTDRRRPTEQKEGGHLFLPTANRAYFEHHGSVDAGADLSLGWGPVISKNKQHYRMHQSIRLRKPGL